MQEVINKLAEDDFRCPVCKAKQPLSPACRRCQADLELVYRVRLRLKYVLGQPRSAEVNAELFELAPGLYAHEHGVQG